MKERKRAQILAFSIAVGCFTLGTALYLLFRPTQLLMFHWVDTLGMAHLLSLARSSVNGIESHLPAWVVLSLPFALWIIAYLFFIEAVWAYSHSWKRLVWFWCVPLIAISAELAQIKHLIPGSFDWVDLITMTVAILFSYFTACIHCINKEKE